MRSLINSRVPSVRVAAVLAVALVIGGTATVDAKRPPKPSPPPSPSATVEVAPSGTMDPNSESVLVDVTAMCPEGWTWAYGRLYVLQADRGGAGTFSVPCTGASQVAHVKVVNGNRFQLGNWTANAYVGIERNGQEVTVTSTRTIRLEPGVTALVADQGQLTGTSGGGVRIAVAVACPTGTTGQESYVAVSQGGTALGRAFFTPTCDGRPAHCSSRSRPHRGRSTPAAPSATPSSRSLGTARRSSGSTTAQSRSSSRRRVTLRPRRRPAA